MGQIALHAARMQLTVRPVLEEHRNPMQARPSDSCSIPVPHGYSQQ